jgi:hypothetical protein
MKKILLSSLVFILVGCFAAKTDTPESLLQHYVYLAFSGAEEKDLEQHFTPKFLQAIKEEQQANAPMARKISLKDMKLKKYSLINKNCEKPDVCQIRFEIDYEELNAETKKPEFVTATRKIAVLIQAENKEWKIDDLSHLRTQHEIKNQIDVPSNQ